MTPEPRRLVEAARVALACLDLTSLNPGDDERGIDALCARAIGRAREPLGCVAAVCVWPRFVGRARASLPPTIRVAAVANFPGGELDVDRALADSEAIAEAGGDEVDLVLPYRALMRGDRRAAEALVVAVRRAVPRLTLKLILETGELVGAERIAEASRLGLDAGVDFLKTSTGKTAVSATPAAAGVMLATIAAHARRAQVGFKPAGGLRRVADTLPYLELVREWLGAEALRPARLRFGASALIDDIEAVLCGLPGGAGALSAPAVRRGHDDGTSSRY